MKSVLGILFVLVVAVVAYAAHLADHLLGVVAYTHGYLAFCLLASLLLGAGWFACFKRHTLPVAMLVFGLLGANFFLPPPSERLLRTAMVKAPPGTDAGAIETIVEQAYAGSPFALPAIKKDRGGTYDRIHVSLLSQQARSCTSLIFLIEDEKVVRSIYSPD